MPAIGRSYWRAWQVLDQHRSFGAHGPQPITFEAIRAYAHEYGLPRDEMLPLIEAMEGEYFAVHAGRMAAVRKRGDRDRR